MMGRGFSGEIILVRTFSPFLQPVVSMIMMVMMIMIVVVIVQGVGCAIAASIRC